MELSQEGRWKGKPSLEGLPHPRDRLCEARPARLVRVAGGGRVGEGRPEDSSIFGRSWSVNFAGYLKAVWPEYIFYVFSVFCRFSDKVGPRNVPNGSGLKHAT